MFSNPESTANTPVATSSSNGLVDQFTTLLGGYFKWREAEAQADATGQSQHQAQQTAEYQTAVHNQQLTPGQYAGWGAKLQSVGTDKLLIGGVFLLGFAYLIGGKR